MYKIVITELAEQDLDAIVEYIALKLKNRKAATDFLDEVENCYQYLATMPKMYSVCDEPEMNVKGYRKVPIKNYLAVFSLDETNNTVTILRFLYSARDFYKLF
jgi:plasmid stabilization system protein ParE